MRPCVAPHLWRLPFARPLMLIRLLIWGATLAWRVEPADGRLFVERGLAGPPGRAGLIAVLG